MPSACSPSGGVCFPAALCRPSHHFSLEPLCRVSPLSVTIFSGVPEKLPYLLVSHCSMLAPSLTGPQPRAKTTVMGTKDMLSSLKVCPTQAYTQTSMSFIVSFKSYEYIWASTNLMNQFYVWTNTRCYILCGKDSFIEVTKHRKCFTSLDCSALKFNLVLFYVLFYLLTLLDLLLIFKSVLLNCDLCLKHRL